MPEKNSRSSCIDCDRRESCRVEVVIEPNFHQDTAESMLAILILVLGVDDRVSWDMSVYLPLHGVRHTNSMFSCDYASS